MALCPFAKKRLIRPGSSDPRIRARVAVLHVDAGNSISLFRYFRWLSGGIESHFFIKKNGVIEQYRDTDYQADANLKANDFAISIETQGFGSGEWTEAQILAIQRLLVWLNGEHPAIRLAVCDGAFGSGIGYHVQFGAPGPWTPVAKSCPGPDRVRQFWNTIAPWLRSGAKEVDEMDAKEREQFADEVAAKVAQRLERQAGKISALSRAVRRLGNALKVKTDDKESRR